MNGFPEHFYWGSSTSAHQVEGGNINDWSDWEKENAARLAKEALNKNYPDYILNDYPGPLRRENYISGRTCDHYNRYEEDFDIAKSLGHNAHRFSIEWSRIEPEEGKFNEKEIEHYREVINALKTRGIEPFVTLWHWTLPIWFSKLGGWTKKGNIKFFERYAAKIVSAFESDVKFWTTVNEPETFARHGYLTGRLFGGRPPAEKNIFKAYRVLKNIFRGHQRAYKIIKKINKHCQVGFTESLVYFESYDYWPYNLLLTGLLKWWRNNPFLDRFVESADFIGLQYYYHSRIRFNIWKSKWGIQFNEDKEVSDLGWEIYPEGIYKVLKNLAKYEKPIFITENGLADAKDKKRADFIKEHLKWVNKAVKEGADVRGYFYWSLLDNFEWDKGYWPRFGLVEVNYKTMERKIRKSALEYRNIILKDQNLNK
ncbi:MAG: glycoside hydrolase family 1 protein [Candidatus Niyogibacteria bacterium]|nr:MAG: glycoside hydrolase family 1 protein [Candidatus Niyogibacteria bacterium]